MKFFTPNSKEELYNFLAEKEKNNDTVEILAGGTSLIGDLQVKGTYPNFIVDIKKIEELKEINYKYEEEILSIGSAVTFTEITENDYINDEFEILVESTLKIPFRPTRNRATIGGNLFDPQNSIIAPVLLVADASLKMRDSNGEIITIPISEFYSKEYHKKEKYLFIEEDEYDEFENDNNYNNNDNYEIETKKDIGKSEDNSIIIRNDLLFVESIEIPNKYFNSPAKILRTTEDYNNDYESLVNLVALVTEDNKIRFAESACSAYPLFLGEYSLSLSNDKILEEILSTNKVTFECAPQELDFKKYIFELLEFGRNPDEEIMINSTVDEKMHTFFTTDKKSLFTLFDEEELTETPYVIFNGRVVDTRDVFSIEAKDAQIETIEYLLTFEDSTAYKFFKSLEKHKVSDSKQYLKEIVMLFYEIVRENPILKPEDLKKIIEVIYTDINFENLVTAIKDYQKENQK